MRHSVGGLKVYYDPPRTDTIYKVTLVTAD
jgi:hypothetical protein